ncbi:MAG: zinc ribbon domain-containing protein [Paenibacillus lautus]|uniref:zinc ribbon domain-containing protein n=1 Tax=Paenibacillus lautus TaxID=1401 RepID=UPI0026EB542C|nr:zinc ribbon domain-containing protein [Paenibacillus lautus]MCI1774166.1 zinc ribbon domain-containing protein [Paenibacillus lautus]
MRSIKPGRGPSAMGAVGSVAVGIFGIFWTISAANMGAPVFFVLFGVVFVGVAVVQVVFHLKNATGTNRMSIYDITDDEPDPLDPFMKADARQIVNNEEFRQEGEFNFCPYCGRAIKHETYQYCPKCGNDIGERL